MKEYIEKQELNKLQRYEFGVSLCNTEEYVKISDICALPTVTKEEMKYKEYAEAYEQGGKDALKEFARALMEEIKKRNFSLGEILGFEKMIGDLLKGMGCCDDIG